MIEFLTPVGWLVACAAVLPIGAAILRERRERPVRRILGLMPPQTPTRAATVAAATLAIVLLAAATARPSVRTNGVRSIRTDAQIYFVLDVSRSMLARLPGGETRFQRAVAATETFRSELRAFPAGIASITDRPLPHLLPTGNRRVFTAVLHRSLGVQRPAPEAGNGVIGIATSFDPLSQIATAGYFGPRATHRLVILLSDGESTAYSPDKVANLLHAEHVGLVVVRFWNARERVYAGRNRIEPYRPNPRSLVPLERLAARKLGGRIFTEQELGKVAGAARKWLGHGRSGRVEQPDHFELAPYAALAAVVPIAFLLRRRDP